MQVINNHAMKIIAFLMLTIHFVSCSDKRKNCSEIQVNEEYTGVGCIFYFDDNQDGMNSLYYFPICQKEKLKIDSNKILNNSFLNGICFKVSRMGKNFEKLKRNKYFLTDINRGVVHYVIVQIHFNKNKSSMSLYSKNEDFWTLNLNSNGLTKGLRYYISNDLNLMDLTDQSDTNQQLR